MVEKHLLFNDKLNTNDSIVYSDDGRMLMNKVRPLTKTRVMGFASKNGNQFGEKLFDEENQIVIGGAMYILEKLFGVEASLHVENINNMMGVYPNNQPNILDTYVCLFGVGIGGCGDSIRSEKDVNFKDREVTEMIPFRITDEELTGKEGNKYWFKQHVDNKIRYYLKSFEVEPVIKCLWRDGEGDEEGSEVEAGVHESGRTEPIETFVELILKIDKKDVLEYFEMYGDIELARINSIGLFIGKKGTMEDGTEDYQQVKLFSKLHFKNIMLELIDEMTIVYRIYTS